MTYETPPPYSTGPGDPTKETKKGSGCFFYGCVSFLVGMVLLAVGGYIGIRVLMNKFVDHYTEPTAVHLPESTVGPEKGAEVKARIKSFVAALENPGTASIPVLQVSADELNAVVATDPEFSEFQNKVHITFDDNALGGQFSYPLDDFGFPGRYVNGSARFRISLENGILLVTLDSVNVKGQAIPEEAMNQIRGENLAGDVYKDPKKAEVIQKLESIRIENGVLTVKARVPVKAVGAGKSESTPVAAP